MKTAMGSTLLRSLSLRAALVAACFFAAQAGAQAPPTPPPAVVVGQPSTSLSVSGTSSRVALPVAATGFVNVYVYNDGAQEAFVVLGSSSVVATTTGIPVPPGMGVNLWIGGNTNLAAITSTSTTTLRITQSNGPISWKGYNPAAGGGSGVTSFNTRTGAVTPQSGDYSNFYAAIATTLAGYGITDAYTKTASDARYVLLAGNNVLSAAGAASSPALLINGAPFAGTASTSWPLFLIQPAGTTSSTWVTPGTLAGINAASGFTGRILDIQLNGTSRISVSSAGLLTAGLGLTCTGGSCTLGSSTANVSISHNAGSGTVVVGDGTTTGSVTLGGGSNSIIVGSPLTVGSASAATASTGEIAAAKIAASGTAPGAAFAKMAFVCGTNSGSVKLIAYAGTSTTPATILDNIGSGVMGC